MTPLRQRLLEELQRRNYAAPNPLDQIQIGSSSAPDQSQDSPS
jgi:hypothetical protein